MAKLKEIILKINRRGENESNIPVVSAKDLKTLISTEQYNTLVEGDEEPFIFAQAIEFPVEGNGDVYGEEFFTSFLARNENRPFPGDKYGHNISYYKRQATNFYQIGGEIRGNVAYFKMYVPPKTDSEENTSFIKDIKTNGVDLSLVSRVSYKYNEEDHKYYMLSSEGGERNDAVGYGDGSMDQTIFNSKNNNKKDGLGMDELLEKLNALIKSGETDIPKIMLKLNKSAMLKTEAEEASLRVMNSINELGLGDDPLGKIKEMQAAMKENADKVREAELTTAFGPQTFNADKQPENKKRLMAETLLEGKAVNAEEIEIVKKNSLFLDIAGKDADVNSNNNTVIKLNNDGKGEVKDYSSYTM